MYEKKISKIKTKKNLSKSYILRDFLIDCSKNSMYYGALVRSPSAFGKITNIGINNIPEGYYLYTARDIPGLNKIKTINTDTSIFCTEEVHYIGEPVGIIVGPDIKIARQLASEIQLTFDISTIESVAKDLSRLYKRPLLELPGAIIDKDSVIADIVDNLNILPSLDSLPAPTLNSSYTKPEQIDNVIQKTVPLHENSKIIAKREIRTGFFEKQHTEKQIDDFFSKAAYDIKDSWFFEETNPIWLETSGALCYMEGSTLNVLTPTQWPSQLQKSISSSLKLDENHIAIRKTLSQQKSNTGTWRTTTLAVQTALAATLSNHPVKLMLSRTEQEKFMTSGMPIKISQRSSIDSEGKIIAMQVYIECDAGYINPFANEIADRLTIASINLYNPENLLVNTKIKTSQNPPTSISLETIDSSAFFAIENHMNHIANEIGLHPDNFRFLNINNEKSIFKYKNIKYVEAINAVTHASDFYRKYSTLRLNSSIEKDSSEYIFSSLPKRGIGLSCAYEGAYYLGTTLESKEQKMEVTQELDGSVTINSSIPSQAIEDIWKRIIAENFQIESSNININTNTNQFDENSLPESLTSNISLMTNLLKRCCSEIQKKRFHNPLPIVAKKTPTQAMKKQWNKELFSGYPFYTTSFGTAIVEVEVNPDTYKQKINGIWIAIDCGEILSLKDAENAVKLSISQELELLTDNKSISSNLIKIFFLQSSNPPCQLGALIHNLIPAAFTSAISQAISSYINKIPCLDEELYTLIEQNKDKYKLPQEKKEQPIQDNGVQK